MKKRREAADRVDRTQQSARQIENSGQERRRPRRRGWGTAGRVIGTILLVFVLTAAIFAGIFSAYINSSMRGRVEVYLDEFETKVSTELYYQEPSSGEWTMYHTLFLDSENRIWADLDQIPKDLQKAVVAIEDKRFYTHKGVDWHGTARAIFRTIFGGSVQGGSTITQQLVKNVTGDNQNTVKRKVMEIYRAQEMEKRYEKDEILEAYLNEVYFGYSCYGVVTASLKYFNKDVSELSLAECASLIAITNNPSLYDPLQTDWGLENNRTRQLLVLGAMLEQGKIDQAAYDAAKEENVVFSNGYTILGGRVDVDTDKKDDTDADGGDEQPEEETKTATSSQSYFTDAVIEDVAAALVEKYGLTDSTNPVTGKVTTAFEQGVNMVYGKGYKIYTTQNPEYQKIAEEVCTDTSNLPYTSTYTNSYGEKETEQLQVGMTIVDPYTGYVVAMVGGAGVKQYDRGWNWATSARQCGSAIKPVSVYAPALDDGTINGASTIDDYPVMVLNGSVYPKNANGRYKGLTPLHTAIARSTNTCAVRVVQEYGTSRSYDFMTNKLGFTTLTSQDAQQVGNMGLGGLDRGVTTEEMAAAFAAFANEGIYTAPRTFIRVEDADGNVILENEANASVAMKDTTAALMNSLLQEVVNGGTGYEGRISGMHVAGKTGTTNNDQDRYFVGYTPYYSCAVWVGYVHNQRIIASGNPAASMWQKVMSRIHADLADKDFFSCSGLTYVKVCADSGLLATDNCAEDCRGSRVYSALVAADNAPSAYCNMHTSPIYTVNFVNDDGTISVGSGSKLDYTRPRLEGFEDIEAEDDFMLLDGWSGFFGDDDEPDDTGGEDEDIHTSWWG
jgi:penicillin-binding protein 1A